MAIKTEYYKTREDGVMLNRTYSTEGFYILQNETGIEYSEAVDVEGATFTYTETDKPIDAEETDTNEATETDYQSALADLGVKFDA